MEWFVKVLFLSSVILLMLSMVLYTRVRMLAHKRGIIRFNEDGYDVGVTIFSMWRALKRHDKTFATWFGTFGMLFTFPLFIFSLMFVVFYPFLTALL